MTQNGILFFADRLPPLIGGMEMHARYFIEYFTNHKQFPILNIITKNENGENCVILNNTLKDISIKDMLSLGNPSFIFFNSGRWIEELEQIKQYFPKAIFIYRTGGNEILKASLTNKLIQDHSLRQSYWVNNLNSFIDILITNSNYTETRLRKLGVKCSFIRCVGGVNASALKLTTFNTRDGLPIIFCAARFVPYKNYDLLISVIRELKSRRLQFKVRIAGDGPLFTKIKEQVLSDNLDSIIEFLGAIDNEDVCQEISKANLYIQLSADQVMEVPNGSYIHSEGMGRSVLEAITAGTFVIAARSGALPEVVTADRGVLVELNSIEQIANEVEQALMRSKIKLSCLDDFSWTTFFKSYEVLLKSAV